MDKERRKALKPLASTLTRELNPSQSVALAELEHFGWELKFIRHQLFQDAMPVVFDPDRTHYAVLRADGTLDENPPFKIRH